MQVRVTIAASRRMTLWLGWTASVIAACGLGWGVARREPVREPVAPIDRPTLAANVSLVDPTPKVTLPAVIPIEPVSPASVPPPPAPKPKPPKKKVAKPPVEPPPDPDPPVLVSEAADSDPAPILPEGPTARERARQVDQLSDTGESERARATAEALLADFPGTSALSAALVADGADEPESKLTTVRVLQVAGRNAMSQALARELKRSYSGTSAVLESIDRWGVLTPQIVGVESSIADGEDVVVTGTLQNPDIGEVRQVRIVVEAIDAGGSVLAKAEARVRPKVLLPGSQGDFTARFKKLDPTTVMRTRTVLLGWQSEVLDAS